MNTVIRWLIISDIVCLSAAALFSPIFALFVQESIVAVDATVVVGTATAIFLLVQSIAQVPLAQLIDKIRGERDDYAIMFWGMIFTSLIPLLYLVIHTPVQLYVVQAVYGLGTAATFPSFLAIFTRHVDHHNEGTEWGVYYTMTGIASAATAAIGGQLATIVGFNGVIEVFVVASVLGSLLLLPIKHYVRKRS
jgi:DHA1 family quinolone resistance protein-like MFS transporter